jgi:hypothetical protein
MTWTLLGVGVALAAAARTEPDVVLGAARTGSASSF